MLPDDNVPVLHDPMTADCGNNNMLCSFTYSPSLTAILTSVEVRQAILPFISSPILLASTNSK